jgi:hypothetical protein
MSPAASAAEPARYEGVLNHSERKPWPILLARPVGHQNNMIPSCGTPGFSAVANLGWTRISDETSTFHSMRQ